MFPKCPIYRWSAITLLLACAFPALSQEPVHGTVEWPAYGNDLGGTRFSSLRQVTRDNVSQLKVAWTYRTGALQPETDLNKKAAFEATPLMVGGLLYVITP